MPRRNPWDTALAGIEHAMRQASAYLDKQSEGMEPFDSHGLSRDEELLVYLNPAAMYPGETDEATGLPLSNAVAAQRLLEDMGAVKYTEWVEAMETRLAGHEWTFPDETDDVEW